MLERLVFGTAGIPLSTNPRDTINGIKRVKELGLGGMELEFVQSVNISKDKAPVVKEVARKEGILLTAHGQYFINLNSLEREKEKASIQRILNAARILHLCGGYSLCFHAGFYLKMEREQVYSKIRDNIRGIVKTLKDEGIELWIRPETTGKETQFGNIEELVKLSSEVDNVLPCVDFSHLHARSNGKFNTYSEFSQVLELIERGLGRDALNNMHIHVSGIEYGSKGEKRHLFLKDSDMNYKELMRAFRDFRIKGIVISESPSIEGDAILMKEEYEKG